MPRKADAQWRPDKRSLCLKCPVFDGTVHSCRLLSEIVQRVGLDAARLIPDCHGYDVATSKENAE
jgi:hypothetical protein